MTGETWPMTKTTKHDNDRMGTGGNDRGCNGAGVGGRNVVVNSNLKDNKVDK